MIRNITSSFNERIESVVCCILALTIILFTTLMHTLHPEYPLNQSYRVANTFIDFCMCNVVIVVILGYPCFQCMFNRERYLEDWTAKLRADGLKKEYKVSTNTRSNTHPYTAMDDGDDEFQKSPAFWGGQSIFMSSNTHPHGLSQNAQPTGHLTTIYADSTALQLINATAAGGVLGVLEGHDGRAMRARNIKQLDADVPVGLESIGLTDGPHVLFLLGSVDWPQTGLRAIRQVLAAEGYERCTVCVPTSEDLWHEAAAAFRPDNLGGIAFDKDSLRGALHRWLQAGNSAVGRQAQAVPDVHAVPMLSAIALGEDLFVVPDSSRVFPSISTGHDGNEDEGARQMVDRVALNVAAVLNGLQMEGDFYSLGEMSRRISRRSMGMVRSQSGVAGKPKAAVVFVDRTLDLVSPLHHSGHILDMLYKALPSLSLDQCDHDREVGGQSLLSTFRTQAANGGVSLWETLFLQDHMVALQILRRELFGILKAADVQIEQDLPPMTGKATAVQLQALVDACLGKPSVLEKADGLVVLAQAVVDSEQVKETENWSQIEGAEKTLKLVLGGVKDSLAEAELADGGFADDSVAAEMEAAWDQVLSSIPAISSATVARCVAAVSSGISIEDAVFAHTPAPSMILMAASLLAPAKSGISFSQQSLAAQRLANDFSMVAEAIPLDRNQQAEQWAARIVDIAHSVAVSEGMRDGLGHWRQLAGLSNGMGGLYVPLIERVARDLAEGGGTGDLEHAEQKMAKASKMLKGFGRRLLSAGHTTDTQRTGQTQGDAISHSTILVFVVGGVTFGEAAQLAKLAAAEFGGRRRLLVGSTGISTAASIGSLLS
ncbi:Sec1 domain-containing protein 2 [Linderina pennispora]|nr:Sec1 domain-containing protein 2 [Linderina pennispora]